MKSDWLYKVYKERIEFYEQTLKENPGLPEKSIKAIKDDMDKFKKEIEKCKL